MSEGKIDVTVTPYVTVAPNQNVEFWLSIESRSREGDSAVWSAPLDCRGIRYLRDELLDALELVEQEWDEQEWDFDLAE